MRNENPLVSIIVVTYNSARFVIETLESAKAQTYQNLELIITDDCSTDSTIKDCENWIAINGTRFVSAQIITSKVNTGTSGNCNRGIKHAMGTWLKLIAGDDVLLENCIEDNVEFCKTDEDVSFLFSDGYVIDGTSKIIGKAECDQKKMRLGSTGQYKEFLKRPFIVSTSSFINKEELLQLGGFDEKIKMVEDYPLWLKATRVGYKFYYLDKKTILYREHENSIMHKMHSKNDLKKKRLWMEAVLQICDQTYIQDLVKFKLYSYYLYTVFIRKAYISYLNGNLFQYHMFIFLKNINHLVIKKYIFIFIKTIFSFIKRIIPIKS